MSNLGWYQVLTTLAKKVGGPKRLIGLLVGSGVVGGVVLTKGGEAVVKKVKKADKLKDNKYGIDHIYTVKKTATDKAGLTVKEGDTFKVLESDDDAILIEIIGDNNNPYFVSANWLETVSNFKKI